MIRYVEIALPLAIDKTFTYLVPPDLASSMSEGIRVTVPFGRKYATGIVVGFHEQSDVQGIKPVRDVIDQEPVVTGDILRLCRWIAEYYMAPLGEVLKTALPQGFSPSSRRLVRAVNKDSIPSTISSQRRKLLEMVLANGSVRAQDLGRKLGLRNVNSVLNDLAREGLVELEEVPQRSRHTQRLIEQVELDRTVTETLDATIKSLPSRRKKARHLLETVRHLKSTGAHNISSTELLRTTKTSAVILAGFVRAGILSTVRVEAELFRDPGVDPQTLSIVLNDSQQTALAVICRAVAGRESRTFLLHGVTGSGKTQLYIEAIRYCLDQGRGAIVLVPEISLTPQIVRRFNTHFPGIVGVVHSRMSQGERYETWRRARKGDCRVVIGPRSAIFAPVQQPGLIVVDEEHESSYKQYDAVPRYHARDTAIIRAKFNNAVTVLGSATPSMESYHNALSEKYTLLELPARVDDIPMPDVEIVDMRRERRREYSDWKQASGNGTRQGLKKVQQGSFSELLKAKIIDRIDRREGIILLQNRRGFAPFVECIDCGYCEQCERCSVTLTYHLALKQLRCHYCGSVYPTHTLCPACSGESLMLRGIGTQRVEQELTKEFPNARILRMDLDTTTRRGSHERILRKFGDGEADILLGTQMVAKGLDFPRVTLVGVISADTQMLLPDFRSAERAFQLLTQVAGRSGRGSRRGEVLIQTHQTDHIALTHVVDHDFKAFYREEISSREELDYPPLSRLVLIEFKGKKDVEVRKEAERLKTLLGIENGVMSVLGPSPAVLSKINEQYRWHIIIKSKRTHDPSGALLRSRVRHAVSQHSADRQSSVRVIVDVDPVGMM